ncbi:hypothetical protein D3C74_188830 [compost metagenome]
MREVSIRKLLKLRSLPEDDRIELQYELGDLKYQRKYGFDQCPICGEELYRNSWSEEYWGAVETITRCGWSSFEDTHYSDHYSYGHTELIAGNFVTGYKHSTPHEEIERIRDEWQREVVKLKTQYKRNRKLAYRKSRSQQRRARRS